tara:strand:- start:111 stop:341 length:231 start_codon:yes stop_codon:yes gene_type:complete
MTSPLYCGENGCTLHDYKVSPAFCEYEYAKLQRKRERESFERTIINLIKELKPQEQTTIERGLPPTKPKRRNLYEQ